MEIHIAGTTILLSSSKKASRCATSSALCCSGRARSCIKKKKAWPESGLDCDCILTGISSAAQRIFTLRISRRPCPPRGRPRHGLRVAGGAAPPYPCHIMCGDAAAASHGPLMGPCAWAHAPLAPDFRAPPGG